MKKNKKVIIIISILLIVIIASGSIYFISNDKKQINEQENNNESTNSNNDDSKKEDNYKYEIDETRKKFIFYKYDEIEKDYKKTNEYICETEQCYKYEIECVQIEDLENGILGIRDGDNTNLYNFENGMIGKYDSIVYYLSAGEKLEWYYYLSDPKTHKYGILDKYGNLIKDFTMEKLDKDGTCGRLLFDIYSTDYDLIIEKKNNKYGIIKITKDEIVIEHKYDDIRIYNDKYYKAKLEDKWYLYSFDTKEKVHEQGYKQIFFTTDEIIVAQIDKNLYIKDYNGNNIIEDKIETYIDYNEKACCNNPSGINVKYNKEKNKIEIQIDSEPIQEPEYTYDIYRYEYDIKNKKITKIK